MTDAKLVTPLPTPPGKPPSLRRGLLLIGGAAALVGVGLAIVLLTRPGEQPMELYLTAKGLHEQGKDLEAGAALSRARKLATDPRHVELLGELEKDIEQTPQLKIAAQLLESKQHPAAGQVLKDVIKAHPRSERAKALQASLEAAQARAESTATAKSAAAAAAAAAQVVKLRPPAAAGPSHDERPLVVMVNQPPPRQPTRQTARHSTSSGKRHAAVAVRTVPLAAAPPVPTPKAVSEPRPTPPPPPPRADHGQVHVESNEPALVYVDGNPSGRSPARLSLQPGMHMIEVRAERDGRVRAQRRVMVLAGMATTIELKLKKKTIEPNNPYGD